MNIATFIKTGQLASGYVPNEFICEAINYFTRTIEGIIAYHKNQRRFPNVSEEELRYAARYAVITTVQTFRNTSFERFVSSCKMRIRAEILREGGELQATINLLKLQDGIRSAPTPQEKEKLQKKYYTLL